MEQLAPHNQKAYDEIMAFFAAGEKRCAINQATGTGKTSIIAKLVNEADFPVLILAPSSNILRQTKVSIDDPDKHGFMTYAGLTSLFKSDQLSELSKYKMFIFDELHRIGAKKWHKSAVALKELYPDAFMVGATATPDHYQRGNMVMDFFDGNSAGNLTLEEAIKQGILPSPIYIVSAYKLKDQFEQKMSHVNMKRASKTMLKAFAKFQEIDWDSLATTEQSFEDYLVPAYRERGALKVLIFCESIRHVQEVRKTLDPIFKELFGESVLIDEYHFRTSEDSFEEFKKPAYGRAEFLYTIDKFNEGLHIDGLDAIIMLRQTVSLRIYQQQIGRVLSMGGKINPLIFDVVNNFNSVKLYKMWISTTIPENISNTYEGGSSRVYQPMYYIQFINYASDLLSALEQIDEAIKETKEYTLWGYTGTLKEIYNHFPKDIPHG